jgi:hypothetical protein
MSQKNISLFEEHILKIIAIIVALICLLFLTLAGSYSLVYKGRYQLSEKGAVIDTFTEKCYYIQARSDGSIEQIKKPMLQPEFIRPFSPDEKQTE